MITGTVSKLTATLGEPIAYGLPLGKQSVPLNDYLGKFISLTFDGKITCVHCARPIKKSYQQGYCFVCCRSLAQCDLCIMKPETCHYHLGTCREPKWGKQFCFKPHVVYLANSTGLKVGITRSHQIPTRWIDQGALAALPIFHTDSRRHAGLIEVCLAQSLNDKTNWRHLFKPDLPAVDLLAESKKWIAHHQDDLRALMAEYEMNEAEITQVDVPVTTLTYPVLQFPEKVKSLSFDKQPEISGILHGIKGQYLMIGDSVLNIRKHQGYELCFTSTL